MNFYCRYNDQEDSLFGEGHAYVEYGEDLAPLRQVDDFGEILLFGSFDYNSWQETGTCYVSELCLNPDLESPENFISAELFESKWQQALLFNDKRLDIKVRRQLTESIVQEIISAHH